MREPMEGAGWRWRWQGHWKYQLVQLISCGLQKCGNNHHLFSGSLHPLPALIFLSLFFPPQFLVCWPQTRNYDFYWRIRTAGGVINQRSMPGMGGGSVKRARSSVSRGGNKQAPPGVPTIPPPRQWLPQTRGQPRCVWVISVGARVPLRKWV